jgi:hypothetical protein
MEMPWRAANRTGVKGSFDFVTASFREAVTALRMTNFN